MERFDAEGALAAIERHRVTHSQWMPTMFVRLLRLSDSPREWLAHPGSVGRAADGGVRIADADGRELGAGEVGAVWFVRPGVEEPVRDATGAAVLAETPGWGSVGDLGLIDADGYLHLTAGPAS